MFPVERTPHAKRRQQQMAAQQQAQGVRRTMSEMYEDPVAKQKQVRNDMLFEA